MIASKNKRELVRISKALSRSAVYFQIPILASGTSIFIGTRVRKRERCLFNGNANLKDKKSSTGKISKSHLRTTEFFCYIVSQSYFR